MKSKAVQDYYPDDVSHCYGCGKLNEHGHQIKTFWEDDETVTRFTPKEYHTAIPGYVYGGLIASLIDCHSTGTAAAALYRAENRDPDTLPTLRCLTGSLHVDYLKPTPLGPELEIRGKVKDISGRRVTISSTLYAEGLECVRGEVVAVQVSDSYIKKLITGESK